MPSASPQRSAALAPLADLVIVDWNDLITCRDRGLTTETRHCPSAPESLLDAVRRAYGSDGTGILAIRHVPDFVDAKQSLLPMAYQLAHLPESYLETHLTDPASLYNAGWSRGKEKLGKDKPADNAKASYYYNPVTDHPGSPDDRQRYPVSYPANRWPDDALMPGFRAAANRLGRILHTVTVHVARQVDRVVALEQAPSDSATIPPSNSDLLHPALEHTEKVKCRLLYYYPLDAIDSKNKALSREQTKLEDIAEDSWIGWHNDSGFLTALAGELYVDHDTGEVLDADSPDLDPAAGLYVVDRLDQVRRVRIPPDCVAVQLGECAQILTGGRVMATPHCVRGGRPAYEASLSNGQSRRRIARISLPCFVDTPPSVPLSPPATMTRDDVLRRATISQKVPPLETRWLSPEMTFGDFLQKTFETYYEWGTVKMGECIVKTGD